HPRIHGGIQLVAIGPEIRASEDAAVDPRVQRLDAAAEDLRHSGVLGHRARRNSLGFKRSKGSTGGKKGEAKPHQPLSKRDKPALVRHAEKSQHAHLDRRAMYQPPAADSTPAGVLLRRRRRRSYFCAGRAGGSASVASRSFINPRVSTCRIRSRVRFMISPTSSRVMPPFSATSSAQVY